MSHRYLQKYKKNTYKEVMLEGEPYTIRSEPIPYNEIVPLFNRLMKSHCPDCHAELIDRGEISRSEGYCVLCDKVLWITDGVMLMTIDEGVPSMHCLVLKNERR